MTLQPLILNFLMYEENFISFFISVAGFNTFYEKRCPFRHLDFMIIGVLTLLTDFKKSSIHSQRLVFN
jgi:hypothetical protein